MSRNNLNIIQLNEMNFDIIKKYLDAGLYLPSFSKIIEKLKTTNSENEYENLEPWVQWPSFYTGKSLSSHRIFRLGDYTYYTGPDIITAWVNKKKNIVAISPMNLSNRVGQKDIFVPDPWVETGVNGNFYVKWLSTAVKDFVNNNSSGKVANSSKLKLLLSLCYLLSFRQLIQLFRYYRDINGLSFRKAIFLDLLQILIYSNLVKKKSNVRGLVFLNAGAHIQHHYFFNSKHVKNKNLKNPEWYIDENLDPLEEVLIAYDSMLAPFLEDGINTLVLTGLSQDPYVKVKYYYRLLDHKSFLNEHEVKFIDLQPRMTRDFEIFFDSKKNKNDATKILKSICDQKGVPVFGEIEERGNSLFVTSNYPNSILENKFFKGDESIDLTKSFTFVAIKNGMHNQLGYWSAFGDEHDFKSWKIKNIWDFYRYLV